MKLTYSDEGKEETCPLLIAIVKTQSNTACVSQGSLGELSEIRPQQGRPRAWHQGRCQWTDEWLAVLINPSTYPQSTCHLLRDSSRLRTGRKEDWVCGLMRKQGWWAHEAWVRLCENAPAGAALRKQRGRKKKPRRHISCCKLDCVFLLNPANNYKYIPGLLLQHRERESR